MMHRTLLGAFVLAVLASPRADAQALLGGSAHDVATGRPIRCICVTLQDSTGRAVDSTWTRAGGRFQFLVMSPGRFRLHFRVEGMTDVVTEWESLSGDTAIARLFRIPFTLDSAAVRRLLRGEGGETLLRRKRSSPSPRYPADLRRQRVQGGVIAAFAVDPSGRVDTSSVIPLQSTHLQFEQSVLAAMPHIRFEPFTLPPGQDCVLALQPFLFRVELEIRY